MTFVFVALLDFWSVCCRGAVCDAAFCRCDVILTFVGAGSGWLCLLVGSFYMLEIFLENVVLGDVFCLFCGYCLTVRCASHVL